jgi:hypothetical protein
MAGDTLATNIAAFDPATEAWSSFGSGMESAGVAMAPVVFALVSLPNGDLVAGGHFTSIAGVSAASLARWNGSTWSPFDLGARPLGSSVYALTVLPNGDLVAGGSFSNFAGVPANAIARWNGSAWSSFGTGMLVGEVRAIATLPNDEVVAAGWFDRAGGVIAANNIARWNGSAWSPLRYGVQSVEGANPFLTALAVLPNGDLLAGGKFTVAGEVYANRIARWNGSDWSALGSGLDGSNVLPVNAIVVLPNGEVVVGGRFLTAGGVSASNIARWNGSSWSSLGSGTNGRVRALTIMPNGDLVAGGEFTTAGGVPAQFIARWGCARPTCDSIDFNQNSLFPEDQDLIDLLSVLAGGPCSTGTCNDIDFNNDGLFPDDNDLIAFLTVLAGGDC